MATCSTSCWPASPTGHWCLAVLTALLAGGLATALHLLGHATLGANIGREGFAASCPTLIALTLCALAAAERSRAAQARKKALQRLEVRLSTAARELAKADSAYGRTAAKATAELLDTAMLAISTAAVQDTTNKDLEMAMLRWPDTGSRRAMPRAADEVRARCAAISRDAASRLCPARASRVEGLLWEAMEAFDTLSAASSGGSIEERAAAGAVALNFLWFPLVCAAVCAAPAVAASTAAVTLFFLLALLAPRSVSPPPSRMLCTPHPLDQHDLGSLAVPSNPSNDLPTRAPSPPVAPRAPSQPCDPSDPRGPPSAVPRDSASGEPAAPAAGEGGAGRAAGSAGGALEFWAARSHAAGVRASADARQRRAPVAALTRGPAGAVVRVLGAQVLGAQGNSMPGRAGAQRASPDGVTERPEAAGLDGPAAHNLSVQVMRPAESAAGVSLSVTADEAAGEDAVAETLSLSADASPEPLLVPPPPLILIGHAASLTPY